MAQQNQKSGLDDQVVRTLRNIVRFEEQKSKFFFIRRVPGLRIPREWERPPENEYQRQVLQEGFVTSDMLKNSGSEELSEDVRELEQHLLPHFWRVNQQAKYYQNRYYQYQWAFILAAFFTTAFAAVNVYFYAQKWNTKTLLGDVRPTEVLGLLTALISGIAAAVSFLDANQTPQKRWFKARAQAESLRSLYFLFLARAMPFDTPTSGERVHRMRQKVIDVLREAASTPARVPEQPAEERRRPQGENRT
jgi:hypothetical protein